VTHYCGDYHILGLGGFQWGAPAGARVSYAPHWPRRESLARGPSFQPTVGVMEGRPRLVGDWQISQLVGRGSFAAVFHATHATDGRQAAVKEIDTSKLTPKLRDSINTEAALLRQASSPHIVSLWDTIQVR
jgi:serine/threonine protein kinase